MPEICDVAAVRRLLEHGQGASSDFIVGAHENARIEVPLECVIRQSLRGSLQIDPPVQPQDLAGHGGKLLQKVAAAVGEVDPRNTEVVGGLDQAAGRPQRPASGVLEGECADPRIEDLHRLGTVLDLGAEIGGHGVGEGVDQPVESLGMVVGE